MLTCLARTQGIFILLKEGVADFEVKPNCDQKSRSFHQIAEKVGKNAWDHKKKHGQLTYPLIKHANVKLGI